MRREKQLSCDSLKDLGIGTTQPTKAKTDELYQVLLGPGDSTAISYSPPFPEISSRFNNVEQVLALISPGQSTAP